MKGKINRGTDEKINREREHIVTTIASIRGTVEKFVSSDDTVSFMSCQKKTKESSLLEKTKYYAIRSEFHERGLSTLFIHLYGFSVHHILQMKLLT